MFYVYVYFWPWWAALKYLYAILLAYKTAISDVGKMLVGQIVSILLCQEPVVSITLQHFNCTELAGWCSTVFKWWFQKI